MVQNVMQNPAAAADTVARNTERLGDQAHSGIERVSGTAHQAVDRATSAVGSMADRMAATGEQLRGTQEEWMETTRLYVREHPVAAVGIALGVGYLLSRLISR